MNLRFGRWLDRLLRSHHWPCPGSPRLHVWPSPSNMVLLLLWSTRPESSVFAHPPNARDDWHCQVSAARLHHFASHRYVFTRRAVFGGLPRKAVKIQITFLWADQNNGRSGSQPGAVWRYPFTHSAPHAVHVLPLQHELRKTGKR